MAWFLNYYMCDRCNSPWTDEWSCMCDDDAHAAVPDICRHTRAMI